MIKERPQLWMQSHITNIQTRFVLVQATAFWAEIYNNRMAKERDRERKEKKRFKTKYECTHETQLKRRGQQQLQFLLLLLFNREFITCLCYGFFSCIPCSLCTGMNLLALKWIHLAVVRRFSWNVLCILILCYSLSLRPFKKNATLH